MKHIQSVYSLPALLLSTSTVCASTYFDSNPYDIKKVYTSSKITVESNESIVPLTVITDQDIERFGIQSFEQLFLLIPQLNVAFDGTGIDVSNNISTLEPLRMQVLIDGVVAYGTGVLEMHWEKLPISVSQIQRVEVVHSPSSSVYGSNAFENVINIITKKPQSIGDQFRYIERGFERRLFGHLLINNLYNEDDASNFHHNTGLSIDYVDSDGYDHLSSPWDKLSLKARSVMMIGDHQTLDLTLAYTEMNTKHWDSSWEGQAPNNSSEDWAFRLNYENQISERSLIKIITSADVQKESMKMNAYFNPLLFLDETRVVAEKYGLGIDDIGDIASLPVTPELIAFAQQYALWLGLGSPVYNMDAALKNNTERYYTGFDYLYNISDQLTFSISSNARYENYDTDFAKEKDSVYQLNHATELAYHSLDHDLIIQAAVMAERIKDYDYEAPYRLGFNAGLTSSVRVRGSYDTSYRWPSPYERLGLLNIPIVSAEDNPFNIGGGSSFAFYQQADNTHLKPESVSSTKIGLIVDTPGWGRGYSDSVFEITAYHNDYDDLILGTINLGNSYLSNDGSMYRIGLDTSLIGEYENLFYRLGASWAQDSNHAFTSDIQDNFEENVENYGVSSALAYVINDVTLRGKYFWRYIPDQANRTMYGTGVSYKGIQDAELSLDAQYITNSKNWSASFDNRPDELIISAELVFDF
ncbi:hypothetical protein VroAM7_49050 (plasmid) [Vibrio rotiferianus]|uniref:TonB-dependent receptor plug domain-containing protein n=1 Tax=Vibrio rotiferianus TaxID=190895 RepID=A0A510IEQ2_9VIBR|nr:TonB-dependent receptor plug domain-containing protein [Vibrio rotiferianus]BBL92252.1 hypothetical protein VroAM7_49050 [Vibrio rotiferianus]